MKQLYKIFIILALLCNFNSIYALDNSSKNTTVDLFIDAPIIKGSPSVCRGTATTLSIDAPAAGAIYTWHKTPDGSDALIASGTSFTTPALTAPVTYYAKIIVTVTNETAMSTGHAISINPLPVSSFTAPTTIDCATQAYSFTNNSTGNNLTYLWDFGNPDSGENNASTDQTPNHFYVTTPGNGEQIFTVKLTVTSSEGCTSTTSNTVKVKQSPDAAINGSGLSTFNNQPIFKLCNNTASTFTFTNTSSTSTSNQNYIINWGDGTANFTSASWNVITHIYAVGFWTITYTILGNNGCLITKNYDVFVGLNPAVALGNPGNTDICNSSSLTFPITGTTNNPLGTKYIVSFNDGTASQTFNHPPPADVTHFFDKSSCGQSSSNGTTTYPNSFSANIVAINPCGESSVGVVPIRVSTPPKGSFTLANTSGCKNTAVCMTNTTTGGNQIDGGVCDSNPKIVWSITPSAGVTLTSGTYGNTFSLPDPSLWQSGSKIICPKFANTGTYTITMTVANRCGQDVITKTICIEDAITPSFTLNNNTGCKSLAVKATNTTPTSGACNVTYNWAVTYTASNCGTTPGATYNYFTNNTTATSANPSFNFPNAGTYTVKLTATNSCSPPQTASQIVTVKQPPTVTVAAINSICGGTSASISPTATVTNCGTLNATYLWTFTGGSPATSTSLIPGAITYATSGSYSATLAVTTECGTVIDTKTFTVTPAVIANAGADVTICSGTPITLAGAASGGNSVLGYNYKWLPVTGLSSSTIANPVATPTVTTTYTLTVTNETNGCIATDEVIVSVNKVNQGVIGSDRTICSGGDPAAFTVTTAATGDGTLTYQWESTTNTSTGYADIAGATSADYDPPVLTVQTWYRRKVTSTLNGFACTTTGNSVVVNINTIIAGTIAGDQTICGGGTPAAFTVTSPATGSVTPTYQWQVSTDNITFTNVTPGGISVTYTPPALTQTTYYRRIATSLFNGVACTAISNVIIITITAAPQVVTQPLTTQTLCANASPQPLTITATGGTGTLTYQWYRIATNINTGGTPISGATQPTFTPPTATVGTTYYYCVVSATGPGCFSASATAQVIVTAAPVVLSQPQSQTVCIGQPLAQLTVTYQNGNGTPTYQWYSNTAASTTGGTAIAGQTTANFQPDATVAATNYYYVIITFPSVGCSVLTSAVATITINQLPLVISQTASICSGLAFTITPLDGGGNTIPTGTQYRWTAPTGNGFTGGSAQNTLTNTISQTLTNTTNTAVTATYTITPVANGCSGTPFTAVITINPKPVIGAQTAVICSGDIFTVIPANADTTIVPAGTTYTWSAPTVTGGITGGAGSVNVATISGNLVNPTNSATTATYTVTPISPTGNCAGTSFTVIVTVNPMPVITGMQTSTCSGIAFTAKPVNGTNGLVTANTTYTWAAPAAITGITGLASGTDQAAVSGTLVNTTTAPIDVEYTVTPKSGNCTGATFIVKVTVSPMPTVAGISNQTVCNGSATSAITFTGSLPSTQFNWTNSNPAIGLPASGTGDIASFTATNTTTSAITATITVTPVLNSCTGTPQTFTITVNPAPTVVFSIPNQTICSATASAVVNLSSATPGTTISWTASIPAGITGAQPSGTTTIPAQTLINTTSGSLTVTYTATAATSGASTCPGAPSVYTITVNPVPFVSVAQQTATCSGSALNFIPENLNGNNMPAGVTFTWATPTGTGFTGGSAQATAQTSLNQTLINTTVNPVTATYTVTPKFGGCTGVPFMVEVTVSPTAVIRNTILLLCNGNTFTFDPATVATRLPAGTIYSWSAPAGNVTGGASGSGQSVITGTLATASATAQTATYTITPTSPAGNCTGAPFTLTVTVNPVFDVTSVVSDFNGFQISTAGANDGSITLTPTGGSGTYTYAWTGPNGFTASTKNITNLRPGTYTVIVSDGLCATITRTFIINEPLPLVFIEVLPSHVNVNCFGQATGVIEVTITQVSIAPFDYAILRQDGTVVQNVLDSPATSHTFSNLPAGTYNIRVTDANNTIKFLNGIVITQPATGLAISSAVVSDFNGFSISCNGANNGSIDLTITGGYPAYTYGWTGPNGFSAATQDIANLSPGVYIVVIQDTTNACSITQPYTITEPLPVAFTEVVADYNGYQVSCFGGNNGSITVTPVGGTSKYTYAWTGPNGFTASTLNISNLVVGTYQLTLTDTNGCSPAAQTFALTQPAALTITESHVNVLCFGGTTGSINVDVQGGTPTTSGIYTYAWTGPNGFTSTTQNLTNVAAGTYNLIATDANGCTISIAVTLTQQPEIIIIPTTTAITCYGANNASIDLKISGGNAPYTTAWSNLATGTYQDNLAAGIYVITVTDASNCVKVINVVIPEAPVFKVEPVFKNVSCNGAKDGSITLNLTGGVAPVTLIWSDGSTAGTQRNNLGPGKYIATITDGTPCNIVRTFTIIEPKILSLDANITHALVCNDTQSGAIDLLVAGGKPPYTFGWSNGATTEDLTQITSGNYAVIVIDANGCTKSAQYTITRQDPIILKVSQDVSFNCDTHTVRQVNVAQASGGVPPFTYSWSSGTVTGANGQTMTTNVNGTVIVTATDSKGCDAKQTIEIDTQQLDEALFVASSYSFATYGWYSISDPVAFINMSAGDYTQVAWNFGDGSVSTDDNPTHIYVREGTYEVTLTVTYPYGCVDTYKYTIVVTKGYDVMIPNGFTPNADGINDSFSAVYKGLKNIQLDIYDTWGSLIYSEKGAVIKGWNGYVSGVQSENGNYYYKIRVETFYSQMVNFEGPLVLIK